MGRALSGFVAIVMVSLVIRVVSQDHSQREVSDAQAVAGSGVDLATAPAPIPVRDQRQEPTAEPREVVSGFEDLSQARERVEYFESESFRDAESVLAEARVLNSRLARTAGESETRAELNSKILAAVQNKLSVTPLNRVEYKESEVRAMPDGNPMRIWIPRVAESR